MTHHTKYARWYASQSDEFKKRKSKRSDAQSRRVTKADHRSVMGGIKGPESKECLSCHRRMPVSPAWRTQCKDCDPVRTVD